MLKPGLERLDGVSHAARAVNNNLYPFEKPDNAHFIGRPVTESDMLPKTEPINQADDHFPFVDSCLPYVKAFSYVWFHLQAAKRQYFKKNERKMPLEEELKLKNKLQGELHETKQRWATRLLAKLRKDIDPGDREKLAHCLVETGHPANSGSQGEGRTLPCVLSIADLKGKMRRIDCLRQADKVWRLDIVLAVLFRAVPLESTDGERVEKSLSCRQPLLCVNPFHLNVGVRELDMFLSNYLFNFEIPVSFLSAPKANQAQFVAVSDGVYSRCVFGARELLELSKIPINTDTAPCSSSALPDPVNNPIPGTSKQQQQQNEKLHSAFKPLPVVGANTGRIASANKDLDHNDCDKDGASDEEVASLVGPPVRQFSIAGHQRMGQVRPQQQSVNTSSRQQNCFTSQPSFSSQNSSNRVVVVPSGLSPVSGPGTHHSFQPIRTSPPISTSSVAPYIKQEMTDVGEKINVWNNRPNYPGNSQQPVRQKPAEIGTDRLEDFANYVVEAASRSNSPVRKQPRLSIEGMHGSSEYDLTGPTSSSAVASSQFQSQPVLSGLSSPSLMMHAGMMMINGMQAVANQSATNPSTGGPPPPPTHPLLYSPNPFSLFSSPAITPRTTPRSTPVPNAQSTFAAAVAAAAAQMGAADAANNNSNNVSGPNNNNNNNNNSINNNNITSSSNNDTSDRDRQLQLAAGLFEQNLRVFGLLGAVSGSASQSGSSTLFRNPAIGGLSGLASGLGSTLMSGADTGNAGQTTPLNNRSPTRDILYSGPSKDVSDNNNTASGNSVPNNHEGNTTSLSEPRPVANFDNMWSTGTETPQCGSGGSANGQGNSSNNSNSGDETAFVLSQTNTADQTGHTEQAVDDAKKGIKPNLTLVSNNTVEQEKA